MAGDEDGKMDREKYVEEITSLLDESDIVTLDVVLKILRKSL